MAVGRVSWLSRKQTSNTWTLQRFPTYDFSALLIRRLATDCVVYNSSEALYCDMKSLHYSLSSTRLKSAAGATISYSPTSDFTSIEQTLTNLSRELILDAMFLRTSLKSGLSFCDSSKHSCASSPQMPRRQSLPQQLLSVFYRELHVTWKRSSELEKHL